MENKEKKVSQPLDSLDEQVPLRHVLTPANDQDGRMDDNNDQKLHESSGSMELEDVVNGSHVLNKSAYPLKVNIECMTEQKAVWDRIFHISKIDNNTLS